MDTNPLPSQDDDISDNGIVNTYVIRITSHAKFTGEQLNEFLDKEFIFYQYVVGKETVPQEHYHIVVTVDTSITEQDVRDVIKAFIIPFWVLPTGKLPKGFGNKQYNCQESKDLNAAVSYAVKLGEFYFSGFTQEFIDERKAESFEKKKPSNFKSEYIALVDDFQKSQMDIREFMIGYINLKAKYGQQVVMTHVYGYALSNLCLRDPSFAGEVVNKYLDRI